MTTPDEPELDERGMPVLKVRAQGQDNAGGHQGIHATFALSSQNPVVQLLPRDYSRLEARVMSTGATPAPVILAQSREIATAAASQGTAFTGPAGSWLPASVDRVLRNCDELWAAWTGTPALVSVIVSRRLPDTSPNAG
jgi:hypothetical protein